MTEFRFSPIKLPEPPSDRVVERAPSRSSCCGNCDQGLPCASKAGSGSRGAAQDDRAPRRAKSCGGDDAGMPPERALGRPSFQAGETCAVPRPMPVSLLPLGAEPLPVGDPKSPFWKPIDIEVKLKPMRLCCPKSDPDQEGCDQNWPSCEDEDNSGDTPRPTPRPKSYCGPIPVELDEWDPEWWENPDALDSNSYFTDVNSYRCALTSCNDAITSCAPLQAGLYSGKSRAQPVFSYSRWKDGKLETLNTPEGPPPHGLADCSLIRAIAYHIDQTQAGDSVHIAIAAWSDVAWVIAKSVALAKDRGVDVNVISGAQTPSKTAWAMTGKWVTATLQKSLGANHFKPWKDTEVHKPFGGAISHNKFVLIHRKSADQHLILLSGANWARFDIARNCDIITISNKHIWTAFREYWDALWFAQAGFSPKYLSEAEDSDAGITAQFWPRLTPMGAVDPMGQSIDNNPFYKIIDKYLKGPGTKIRIIISYWARFLGWGPGKDVLELLLEHKKIGSDVRVIGNHHRDIDCHSAKDACQFQPSTGTEMQIGSCETTDGIWQNLNNPEVNYPGKGYKPIPWAKCAPHSKVLLISGFHTVKKKFHQAVYTGSMNLSYELAMPDAFIGIHNDPVIFSQYEEWWMWLCWNTAMNKGAGAVCGIQNKDLPKKG